MGNGSNNKIGWKCIFLIFLSNIIFYSFDFFNFILFLFPPAIKFPYPFTIRIIESTCICS